MPDQECPQCVKLRASLARWEAAAEQLIATLNHAADQSDSYVRGTARAWQIILDDERRLTRQ